MNFNLIGRCSLLNKIAPKNKSVLYYYAYLSEKGNVWRGEDIRVFFKKNLKDLPDLIH